MNHSHLANLRDKINTGNPKQIATGMYLLVDGMQTLPPATQVQAVALLFLLITQKFQLDRREVLAVGDAILRDAERTENTHINAARMYIEEELLK